MGFEINRSTSKPVIKESQHAHDGGAGNTGYFEQERKKHEHEHEKSIFDETKEIDSFKKEGANDEGSDDFSISKLIAQIILAFKDWVKKIFG